MRAYQEPAWLAEGDPDSLSPYGRPGLVPADPNPRLTALRGEIARSATRSPTNPDSRIAGYIQLQPGEDEQAAVAMIEQHIAHLELRLYQVFVNVLPTCGCTPAAPPEWREALATVAGGRADGILTRTTDEVSLDPGAYEYAVREIGLRRGFLLHVHGRWVAP